MPDVRVSEEAIDRGVGVVEIDRPPRNALHAGLVADINDAIGRLGGDDRCRAIVLAAAGRHFCAGADFEADGTAGVRALYNQAVALFSQRTPIVAAVQGAAVGGGLGLAMAADFRVAGPGSRLTANFARLGIHHGFGLTVTLPRAVGPQRAAEMLYRGHRLTGPQAAEIGLVDRLVADDAHIRAAAVDLAADIAASAPLAIAAIRATLRAGLADEVRAATERELAEQEPLFETADFAEGVRAAAERRTPVFQGR